MHGSLNKSANRSQARDNKHRSMQKRDITPSRNVNHRTGQLMADGDRYVSVCSEEQLAIAQHLIKTDENVPESRSKSPISSSSQRDDYDQKMQAMRSNADGTATELRILAYRRGDAPRPGVGYRKRTVLYTCVQPSSSVRRTNQRYMPKSPTRILDAPTIRNDYYLNLIDWGRQNIVAVALDTAVYLWNASSGDVTCLVDFPNCYVSSVKYSCEGRYLSIGTSDGALHVYKLDAPGGPALARKLNVGAIDRVGAIAWRHSLVSYGSRHGRIYHHDVRQQNSLQGTTDAHRGEVCALKWSPCGRYLTSGSADQQVCVCSADQVPSASTRPPLYTLVDHIATVKALDYVPFLGASTGECVLATGGGLGDHTVKLWNLSTGSLRSSIDTGSKVSAITFNQTYREMCIAQAGPLNNLRFYNWTSSAFHQINEIDGHQGAIAGLCTSPDGEYVLSASHDESLRLWHCWKVDKSVDEARAANKNAHSKLREANGLVLNLR